MKSYAGNLFRSATLMALFSVTSCLGAGAPVTVVGAAPDLGAFAGSWLGEYSSTETGRSGTVSFQLRATDDSAFGAVVMTPKGSAGPLRPWQNSAAKTPVPTELTIRFVRITGRRVTGALAPYADPSSGEPLFTTFQGEMIADTISGTYTTRPISGSSTGPTGTWRVQRTRGPTSP